MPRIVDHQQRRQDLAGHVWTLIRRQGLDGVTIRSLGELSGWSSGAVRHYLPNRQSILSFAAEQLRVQTERRLRALDESGPLLERLERFLLALLPLDEEGRAITEVWLAFAVAAVRGESYAESHGVLYAELSDLICEVMGSFEAAGWLGGRTARAVGAKLHALIDGLSLHLLMRQLTPEQAQAVLRGALESWLAPPT